MTNSRFQRFRPFLVPALLLLAAAAPPAHPAFPQSSSAVEARIARVEKGAPAGVCHRRTAPPGKNAGPSAWPP